MKAPASFIMATTPCSAFFLPADVSLDELMMKKDHFVLINFVYRYSHTPSTVHGLDRLYSKSGGYQVVSVVPAAAHQEQAFDLPHYEDQAALCDARTHYTFSHSKIE